jgi:hypothetical protein
MPDVRREDGRRDQGRMKKKLHLQRVSPPPTGVGQPLRNTRRDGQWDFRPIKRDNRKPIAVRRTSNL